MRFDIRETAAERVILCAHRGIWGGNIPCNNLTAYDIAVREGADMVEIDVTKCADGELFIFHPGMEKRHLGMDVHIEQMTADEVRKLRPRLDCRHLTKFLNISKDAATSTSTSSATIPLR